jgi:hypothetical protein
MTEENEMDNDYEEIEYEYTEKREEGIAPKKGKVLYFPNRQIATICDTVENPETHMIETRISKQGMTKEELSYFFKRRYRKKDVINIEQLISSIIYEAYRKEGSTLEEGNVRTFWYTHLKALLVGILGREDNRNLNSSIMQAWTGVIDAGLVTYEEMNIRSEKESERISIVKDSPFSNIIIAVEKLSFFDTFSWLPRLFNCTLMTAGGQPSRAVIRRFIFELKELGTNLDQNFHLCTVSDLDPAGYIIQEAFKDQLEKAIVFYGGTGKVEIHRLFVRKDQVTPELLQAQGIPWEYKKEKRIEIVSKQEDTVWMRFCEKTNGGLYIPKPNGWTGKTYEIDGKMMVRALLEMNVFSATIIENAIINELLKIIRETSDESKIMIPEIMRVFYMLKDEISENLFKKWETVLIDPLKKEFFKEAEEWKETIVRENNDAASEINRRYDGYIEEKEDEKQERVPELFEKKEELEKQIDELENELSGIEADIEEKCRDIDDEISTLNENRNEELQPVTEAYDFRIQRHRQFMEEHMTVFNPIEQALKSNIDMKLMEIDHRFQNLEKRDSIKKEIGSYCINYKLLVDENISCFDHPAPAFKGERFLEKAATKKDVNIGKVRYSFTPTFIDAMRKVWNEDTRDLTFELGEVAQLRDISQEIKDAIEETEKTLKEKE